MERFLYFFPFLMNYLRFEISFQLSKRSDGGMDLVLYPKFKRIIGEFLTKDSDGVTTSS